MRRFSLSPYLQLGSLYLFGFVLVVLSAGDCLSAGPAADELSGRRVMFVNSYHRGYVWSDVISQTARQILVPVGIDFHEVFLDSKRYPAESDILLAVQSIRSEIASWQPDLLIAADDNASKYLIQPYFRDHQLPVVFCGVNGDSAVYGYPYANATGIEENPLVSPLPAELRPFARGGRLGVLSGSFLSDRRNVEYYKKHLDQPFSREVYVDNFADWRRSFLKLQDEVDILLYVFSNSVRGWDWAEARSFVIENIRIPCGSTAARMLPLSLIVYAHVPEEQGRYIAGLALRILAGESPAAIPVRHENQARVMLNLKIAEKLQVVFPTSLLRNAEVF